MTPEAFLFWFLAFVTVISGVLVITLTNPIFAALSLVMTMVSVAAIFVTLTAYFLAGVQLIVYAGAVMVLFVMVLMLFDLKNELQAFTRGFLSGGVKLASAALLAGLLIGAIIMSTNALTQTPPANAPVVIGDGTKQLAQILFSKYLFGFESLGILLMVVAVGAVALARSKGGTHAKH
jgi:NADH-quinone oxidoreductase subunit J